MKAKRLYQSYKKITRRMRDTHMTVFAASGAYYCFLSLVPLVIVVLSLLPYTPLTREMLNDALFALTPAPFLVLVETIIGEIYDSSVAILSISAVAQLWSGAKFLSSLARGIGMVYDGQRQDSYLRLKLRGVLYTLLLIIFAILSVSLLVFGEKIFTFLENELPFLAGVWDFLVSIGDLFFLLGMTSYIALLFCSIPQKKRRFIRQLPGAAFATLAWYGFTQLYSWLLPQLNTFGVYGSLSMVVISLLWVYYSVYILLLGALVNTLPEILKEPD